MNLSLLGQELDLSAYKPVFREPRPYDPRKDVDRIAALRRLPAHLQPPKVTAHDLLARATGRLQSWAQQQQWPITSALLMGASGCGKTSAIAWAIRRLIAHEAKEGDPHRSQILRFQWFTASELASAAQRHPLGRGEPEDTRLARHAPILVIDDLGKESTPSVTWLHEVIDGREQRLPTIVTTERRPDELLKMYGSGNLRRLVEGATMLDLHEVTR